MKRSFILFTAFLFLSACGEGLSLNVEGTDLRMNGVITSAAYVQVTDVLDDNPDIVRLVLEDMPGSADDDTMLRLSREMRRRGMNTHVTATSDINSGAVDLFLSGVQRTMAPGAKFGVHSWSDGTRDGADFPRDSQEHENNRSYIVEMLGDDAFYWFTLEAAPAAEIHYMTQAEINRYGLITN